MGEPPVDFVKEHEDEGEWDNLNFDEGPPDEAEFLRDAKEEAADGAEQAEADQAAWEEAPDVFEDEHDKEYLRDNDDIPSDATDWDAVHGEGLHEEFDVNDDSDDTNWGEVYDEGNYEEYDDGE